MAVSLSSNSVSKPVMPLQVSVAKDGELASLPDELNFLIASYLRAPEAAQLSVSGRHWCHLAHSPEFYTLQLNHMSHDFARSDEWDARSRYNKVTCMISNLRKGVCAITASDPSPIRQGMRFAHGIFYPSKFTEKQLFRGFEYYLAFDGSYSTLDNPFIIRTTDLIKGNKDQVSKQALHVRSLGQNIFSYSRAEVQQLRNGACDITFIEGRYASRSIERFQSIKLDFSSSVVEVFLRLADQFSERRSEEINFQEIAHLNVSLSAEELNRLFYELYFMHRGRGADAVANYGEALFQQLHHERPHLSVSNQVRSEAMFRCAMGLIARNFAAPMANTNEILALFHKLPDRLQHAVYYEVYLMQRPTGADDVENYGERVFKGEIGALTNLERARAIRLFLERGESSL